MNFDTRTMLDITKLDIHFKEDLKSTITEEQKFSERIQQYDYDVFVDSISPLLKDKLKMFLKYALKESELSIIKGMVNLEKIDYKVFVNEIQKKIIYEVSMNSLDKFIQFISTGIFTPFAYLLFVIFMIIATFLFGFLS